MTNQNIDIKIALGGDNSTIFFYEKNEEGKYKNFAESSTMRRQRFLSIKGATVKENTYVEAKDLTYKKIKQNGAEILLKYFPERKGKTVAFHTYNPSVDFIIGEVDEIKKAKEEEAKAKKASTPITENFQVGDVVVCSGGYEQTNVDFYQVVGRTKRSVKLREIAGSLKEEHGYDYGHTTPIKDHFVSEEVFTARIRLNGENVEQDYVSSTNLTWGGSAYKWKGNNVYCSWGY